MRQSNFLFGDLERALVLCPHTDDEFGCAGTLLRLTRAGITLRYVALSRCEESVPEELPRDVLEQECRACTKKLGIKPEHVDVWRFPVRHFPEYRQEILQRLVDLNRSFQPQIVFLPSSSDTHQDHATVFNEGFRAYKHCSILGYELPQNIISFDNTAFFALSENIMDKKLAALESYKSQQNRPYASSEFIKGLATVRGVQANSVYAEAFEMIRLVIS